MPGYGSSYASGMSGGITSGQILDGTILDADISPSAVIQLDKLEDIAAGSLVMGDGTLGPAELTIGSARQVFQVNAAGTLGEWSSAISLTTIDGSLGSITPNAAAVTTLTVSSTLGVTGVATFSATPVISGAAPQLSFVDSGAAAVVKPVAAYHLVDLTDTGDGTEDGDYSLWQIQAGGAVRVIFSDIDAGLWLYQQGSTTNYTSITAALSHYLPAVATAQTVGMSVINATAAGAGAQQYSPVFELEGQGWKTDAVAETQEVKWGLQTRPVEGAANPTSVLDFLSSINAGAYAAQMSLNSAGGLSITSFAADWTNAGRTVADAGILTTVDIDGGTIDGTAIGGAVPAAGAFTTIDASGVIVSTVVGTVVQNVSGGTQQQSIRLASTGADSHWGNEGSSAGGVFTGSSAYANVLYTSTPIQHIISGVQAMAWLANGNVVLGNTDALTTARAGNTLRAPNVSTGGAGNIAGADLIFSSGLGTGTGTPGNILFYTAPTAAAGDNAQSLVQRMIITGDGRVGINAVPANFTGATGGSLTILRHSDSTIANPLIVLQSQTTGSVDGDSFVVFGTQSATWSVGVDQADSSKFRIEPAATLGGASGITITTGGNVGIGETSPDTKLHVTGTNDTIFGNLLVESTGGDGIIKIVGGGTNQGFIRYNNSGQYLSLSSNAYNDDTLVVDSTGNVGIGIDVPTAKLHIDQLSTSAAVPVLWLDQADTSEEFIRFTGESAADNSMSLADAAHLATPGAIVGWFQIEVLDVSGTTPIGGGAATRYWVPFYTTPTA